MKNIYYIRTIDIAHPPVKANEAEEILNRELSDVKNSKSIRVLKVIHGYGSTTGRSSVLKEIVKNWCFRNMNKFLAVIPGEEYDIFNASTQNMRKSCGQIDDADLGANNKGITIIWVK